MDLRIWEVWGPDPPQTRPELGRHDTDRSRLTRRQPSRQADRLNWGGPETASRGKRTRTRRRVTGLAWIYSKGQPLLAYYPLISIVLHSGIVFNRSRETPVSSPYYHCRCCCGKVGAPQPLSAFVSVPTLFTIPLMSSRVPVIPATRSRSLASITLSTLTRIYSTQPSGYVILVSACSAPTVD